MARYGMCIDLTTCVGCDACVAACKTENNLPDGNARSWTAEIVTGRFPDMTAEIYSCRCQHCDNPPCVMACPTKASYVQDGIVLINKELCVGCRHCIASCPYGARYLHPEGYVDKCTFCEHRIKEGRNPACVEICPTCSLVFGDMDNPDSKISKLLARHDHKTIKPLAKSKPKYFLLRSTVSRKKVK